MKCPPSQPKNKPSLGPPAKSLSWIAERRALREFGDRRTRAILAIFVARRSAKRREFFVHPSIAQLHGLNPSDLNWALDKLEGDMVETLESRNGRFRTIRLMARFEEIERECATRNRGRGRICRRSNPDEERVTFDKGDLLERLSSAPRETETEVLKTLREIASAPPDRI